MKPSGAPAAVCAERRTAEQFDGAVVAVLAGARELGLDQEAVGAEHLGGLCRFAPFDEGVEQVGPDIAGVRGGGGPCLLVQAHAVDGLAPGSWRHYC